LNKEGTGGDPLEEGLGRVSVDPERCDGCGLCVELCPFNSLAMEGGTVRQVGPCYLCGGCEALCKAIRVEPLLEPKEFDEGFR